MTEDRLLIQQITDRLKAEDYYVAEFDEDDTAGVERVKQLGLAAGQELGWKVHTHATDPDRRDDRKILVVVEVETSTPQRDELMRIHTDKAAAVVARNTDRLFRPRAR